jgi:hypothetical protein
MISAQRISIIAACIAALIVTPITLMIASPAFAQTMGEYGGVAAHSATSAEAMPKVGAADLGSQTHSVADNGSASTHTEEIRTYDEPTANDKADDKDSSGDNSADSWVEVK